MKVRTVAFLGLVALTACAAAPATRDPSGDWELVSMNGGPAPAGVTLALRAPRLSGQAFCNSYGGAYAIRDGRLIAAAINATRMACELRDPSVDPMAAEQTFLSILQARPVVSGAPARLVLRADDGSRLEFRAKPGSRAP